jgi:purine-nucleoside phosphorylase
MPTPHISAEPGDFADVCLLPGDPLRARWVAEQFMDEPTLVTSVRNMEGYTGTYRDRRVSVMGTGMGMPSAGIYAIELIREYGVEVLIRIGSCGGIHPELHKRDIVIVTGASTDSKVNRARFGGHDFAAITDFSLTRDMADIADRQGIPVRVGPIFSSDHFYQPQPEIFDLARRMGVLAVEMETAGLCGVAAEHGARFAAIMSVTGQVDSDDSLPREDRERSFSEMVSIALEATLRI